MHRVVSFASKKLTGLSKTPETAGSRNPGLEPGLKTSPRVAGRVLGPVPRRRRETFATGWRPGSPSRHRHTTPVGYSCGSAPDLDRLRIYSPACTRGHPKRYSVVIAILGFVHA